MNALDLKFKTHYRIITYRHPELPKGSIVTRCKWVRDPQGERYKPGDCDTSVAMRLVGFKRHYDNWTYVTTDDVEEV